MAKRDSFYWLIQGDCLQVLPYLEKEYGASIDLVLTDPPYNIGSDTKLTKQGGVIKTTNEAWSKSFNDRLSEDEYTALIRFLGKRFYVLLKRKGSMITFYDRGRPYLIKPLYDRFAFRNTIIFLKRNPLPHFRKNNYRSGFEQCMWFSKDQYYLNFIGQAEMINYFWGNIGVGLHDSEGRRTTTHPTEKPEWMIKPLIERHSKPGDLILDPFIGSGTVMKVAQDLGRSCIGIDIVPKYCRMTYNRCFGRTFLDREVKYVFDKDLA